MGLVYVLCGDFVDVFVFEFDGVCGGVEVCVVVVGVRCIC